MRRLRLRRRQRATPASRPAVELTVFRPYLKPYQQRAIFEGTAQTTIDTLTPVMLCWLLQSGVPLAFRTQLFDVLYRTRRDFLSDCLHHHLPRLLSVLDLDDQDDRAVWTQALAHTPKESLSNPKMLATLLESSLVICPHFNGHEIW